MSEIENPTLGEDGVPVEGVDEWTMPLKKPIEAEGKTITEIHLREPTGLEWEQFDKISGLPGNMLAIATVSSTHLTAVKRMVSSDIVKATRFLNRFF